MRAIVLPLVACALVACHNTTPISIRAELTTGSDQACPSDTCTDIPMLCDAVLSVRILAPDDPTAPFVSLCQQIQPDHNKDLCSLASIDLPADVELPDETLEVQIAIYPLADIPMDPDTGDLDCPTMIAYAASTGFPDEVAPTPAVGGRAYYHSGDAETVVELGCTDLSSLNAPSCTGATGVSINASVEDFDTEVEVPPSIADTLAVSVGEPQPEPDMTGQSTIYFLDPAHSRSLDRTVQGPNPAWGDNIDLVFVNTACLEVLGDEPQATIAVTCRKVTAGVTSLDLHGFRLAKSTLDDALLALGDGATFPDAGLVVGIVLDSLGNPAPNIAVVPASVGANPTVQYASSDRSTFGGSVTTSSGVFVSVDAPFNTTWTTNGGGVNTANGFGGLVESKVTLVVLQLEPPVVGGGT